MFLAFILYAVQSNDIQYKTLDSTYIDQKYSNFINNQIHINEKSPITQISGCSFTDIESDLDFLIKLDKEVSFFDNVFKYNEKSQKTASPLLVNYNGKLTISYCTFTNAKFGKNDDANVLSTSQSQLNTILDSCSFINCGNSEVQYIIKLFNDKSSIKIKDCEFKFDNKEISSKIIDSKSSDIQIDNCKFTKCCRNSIFINSKESKGTFIFTNNKISSTNNQFIEANKLQTKPIITGNIFDDIELTDKYLITCIHDQKEIEIEKTTFSNIKGSLSFFFQNPLQYSLLFNDCNFYDIENTKQDESSVQIGQSSSIENAYLTFQNCQFKRNNCPYGKGGVLGIKSENGVMLNNCIFDSNTVSQNGATLYIAKTESDVENKIISIKKCKFNINKGNNGCYIYNENKKELQIVSCSLINKVQNEDQTQFAIYSESKDFYFEFSTIEFANHSQNNLVFNLKSAQLIQIDNSEFINCFNNNNKPIFRFDDQTEKSTTSINNCEFVNSKLNPFSIKISGGSSEIKSCYMNYCSMKIDYVGSMSISKCITSNCESMNVNCVSNDLRIKETSISNPFEIADSIIENEDLIDGNIFSVNTPTMLFRNNTATITGANNFNGMVFKLKGEFTFLDSSFTNFGGSAALFTDGSNDELIIDAKNCTFDKCGNIFFFKFASKQYHISNSRFEDIVFSKVKGGENFNCLLQFDADFDAIEVDSCNFTRCYSESSIDLTSILFTPRDNDNQRPFTVTNCNFESCNSTNSMYCILTWTRMKSVEINHNSFIDCIVPDTTKAIVFVAATTVTYEYNHIEFKEAEKGRKALRISTSNQINVRNSEFIRTNSNQSIELIPNDNGEVEVINCYWEGNIGPSTRCFHISGLRDPTKFVNNTFVNLPEGGSIGTFIFEQPATIQTVENCKFNTNTGNDQYGEGISIPTINVNTLKFTGCEWTNNKASTNQKVQLLETAIYNIILIYEKCFFDSNTATTNGGGLSVSSTKAVTITDSEFKSNECPNGKGGAIYVQSDEELTITNCIFDSNSAGQDGFSIYISNSNKNEDKVIKISESKFIIKEENAGYVIYNGDIKEIQIITCTFTGNSNNKDMKIQSSGIQTTIDNSTIENGVIEIKSPGNLKVTKNNLTNYKSLTILNEYENKEYQLNIEDNRFITNNIENNGYVISINSPHATYQNNFIEITGLDSYNGVYFNQKGQFNILDSTFTEIKGASLIFTDSTTNELILNIQRCTFNKCYKNIFLQFQSTDYHLSNSRFEDIIFEEDDPNDQYHNNLVQFDNNFKNIEVDSCNFIRCYSESTKMFSSIILTPRDEKRERDFTITNCNFESCNGSTSMFCIIAATRMNTQIIRGNTFIDCIVPDTSQAIVFITATTVTYEYNHIEFKEAEKGRKALRISTSNTIYVRNSEFIRTNSNLCAELIPNDGGNVEVINCYWEGNIGPSTRCFHISGLRKQAKFVNNTFVNLPEGGSIGTFIYELPAIIQTVENCKFNTNTGNDQYGGGVSISTINVSTLKFAGCEWTNNKAVFSSEDTNQGNHKNGNGGAFQHGFSTTLYKMTLEFDRCLFDSNEADSYGGALSISTINPVKITNCEFKNNKAGIKADIQDPRNGGAIFFDLDFDNNPPNRMESALISNCTFNGNIAMNGGQGNSIYIKGNERTVFTIDQKTNFNNKLTDDKTMSTYEIVSQSTKLNLNDVEFQLSTTNPILFDSNQVQIQGQTYQNVRTNTNSIIKFETEESSVSITESHFIECESTGYIISSSAKTFTIENSEIQNKGINFESSEKVTINQCNFSSCAFKDPIESTKGGAVCLLNTKENGVIEIKGSNFLGCKADFGGCVYFESDKPSVQLKINGCEFNESSAETAGGCIYFKAIQGEFVDCKFNENSGKQGSVIYYECNAQGTTTLTNEGFSISSSVFEQQKEETSLIFFVYNEKVFFNFINNNFTFANNNITRIFDCTESDFCGNWNFDGNRLKSDALSIKTEAASNLPVDCGLGFICDLPFIPGCLPNDRCDINATGETSTVTFIYINKTKFDKIEFGTDGGSIHLINCGIKCDEVDFIECKSTDGAGGGIYIYLEEKIENLIEITSSTFTGCSAVYGGAICAISTNIDNKLKIVKCTFTSNLITSNANVDNDDEKTGGVAIYLSFPNSIILRCKFSQNSGLGGSVKVVNHLNSVSLRQLELNDLSVSVSDCLFEIDPKSSCSIYYSRPKNMNENAVKVILNDCIFKGQLAKGAHHIDGVENDGEKSKLIIQSCKFASDKKLALNLKNLMVSLDFNKQQFNYKEKNEIVNNGSKNNSLFLVVGIGFFVALIIIVQMVKFANEKFNRNENDLIDETEVLNSNFGENV